MDRIARSERKSRLPHGARSLPRCRRQGLCLVAVSLDPRRWRHRRWGHANRPHRRAYCVDRPEPPPVGCRVWHNDDLSWPQWRMGAGAQSPHRRRWGRGCGATLMVSKFVHAVRPGPAQSDGHCWINLRSRSGVIPVLYVAFLRDRPQPASTPQGGSPALRSGDACGAAPSSGAIGNGPEQPKE